jgi:hypothetical protein
VHYFRKEISQDLKDLICLDLEIFLVFLFSYSVLNFFIFYFFY